MILEDYTKQDLVGIVRNYKMNTMGYLKGFNTMKKKDLIDKIRKHPNFNITESERDLKEVKFQARKVRGKLLPKNTSPKSTRSIETQTQSIPKSTKSMETQTQSNSNTEKIKKKLKVLSTKEFYRTMYNR